MQRKVFTAIEINVLNRNKATDQLDNGIIAELQLQARMGVIEKHITVLANDHILPSGGSPTIIMGPETRAATQTDGGKDDGTTTGEGEKPANS